MESPRDSDELDVEVDVTLVRRLLEMQFPQWAELLLTPVDCGGWDNRTFRLGNAMSVRLPSAERYGAQVEKEQRWLPKLAPLLPLLVPQPLALGMPALGYPLRWSVYGWIEGETATMERIADAREFAVALADFLKALHRIESAGGPPPGSHNFLRGGSLASYDGELREAIAALHGQIDTNAVSRSWEAALEASWRGTPVWVHGDISPANLLVRDGRLRAVIDFGCLGVGDPACDLTIAWTLLAKEIRAVFRATLSLDVETWARARGWALWKAVTTFAENQRTSPVEAARARRVIEAVLGDQGDEG